MRLRRVTGVLLFACGLLAIADGAQSTQDARLARATFRCINLAELIACDDALNRRPNSPELLVGEADALVQLRRPGEAIGVYRNAMTRGADQQAMTLRIAGASSLRRTLLETCRTKQGAVAERACEAAWLPGAPDEVALFKRRGALLRSNGAPAAALDAYLAAARLAPKDRVVAREIIALTAGTGRRDQPALSAPGPAKERLRAVERPAPSLRRVAPVSAPAAVAPAAVPASGPSVDNDTNTNLAEVTRSN